MAGSTCEVIKLNSASSGFTAEVNSNGNMSADGYVLEVRHV